MFPKKRSWSLTRKCRHGFCASKITGTTLRDNYALIAANARDEARTQPLEICSTQSKGYDSTAVNAIAGGYGIDKVFTVTKAKSIFHVAPYDSDVKLPNDDGSEICEILGLNCIPLNRHGFAEEFDQNTSTTVRSTTTRI